MTTPMRLALLLPITLLGCDRRAAPPAPTAPIASAPAPSALLWEADNVEGGANPVVLRTSHGDVAVRFVIDADAPTAVLVDQGRAQVIAALPGATLGEAAVSGDAITLALAFHDVKGDVVELEARRLTWNGTSYAVAESFTAGASPAPAWLPPRAMELAGLTGFDYTAPSEREPDTLASRARTILDDAGSCQCGDDACKDAIEARLGDLRAAASREQHAFSKQERAVLDEIRANIDGC